MLNYDNSPIIRHAIIKKLDSEPGVEICEILIHRHSDCIAVGILAVLDGLDGLVVRSRFELPLEFELGAVHAEIDEIAEQMKTARKESRLSQPTTEQLLQGTGLRGRWLKSIK